MTIGDSGRILVILDALNPPRTLLDREHANGGQEPAPYCRHGGETQGHYLNPFSQLCFAGEAV